MAGMAANKLMGLIRDKGNVNGLGKPKERGSKPNGPTWQEWQPTGLQAWQEKEKHKQKRWARRAGTSTQIVPSPWKNKGRQGKPKSPHHLPIPSQYRRGGSWLRDLKSVVQQQGEKRSILRFLPRPLLEKCLAGMAFRPKEIGMTNQRELGSTGKARKLHLTYLSSSLATSRSLLVGIHTSQPQGFNLSALPRGWHNLINPCFFHPKKKERGKR